MTNLKLLSLQKIWDSAPHNAMTDLIRYGNRWYCCFREGAQHVHKDLGKIRIISSDDTLNWTSVALFAEEGVDLRDPKFSITPDEKLLLLMEGVICDNEEKYVTRSPRVTFSSDGVTWLPPKTCFGEHEWPWRLTWFGEKGYTISYRPSDPLNKKKPWEIGLYETVDALEYREICHFKLSYFPSEATLRFMPDGTMVALLRRREKEQNEWLAYNLIGHSKPPYMHWTWNEASRHLGGPNFIINNENKMWASGRIIWPTPYDIMEQVVVADMTLDDLTPKLVLPSGGDSSYPGMVEYDQHLWITYYSSHEQNTAIYFAKIGVT